MAEKKETTKKPKVKPKADARAAKAFVGSQAQPTVLDNTVKLDTDTKKVLMDNIIDAALSSRLDTGALEQFTSISNSRDQIYQLIDTMLGDSTVSSIVKTYAADVCEVSDNGHIIWAESADPKISMFVNYLLNVMNADKNIYGWAYSLIAYGDTYLRLFRESDYDDEIFKKDKVDATYAVNGKTRLHESAELEEQVKLNMHSVGDPYSYYVEMVPDPGTMFELTKFGRTYGFVEVPNAPAAMDFTSVINANSVSNTGTVYNYRLKTSDINVYQADDFVHILLDDNHTRYPEQVKIFNKDSDYIADTNSFDYSVRRGKSMLIDSYKTWREKSLLESSILLNRITKSSIFRKVQVETGDMPREQVNKVMHRVKELFEQKTAINTGNGMGEYTNPGPIENFVYLNTHNGQGAVTIDSIGGDVDVKNLADLDNWINKFYAAYGIPKQYFGYTDDASGFNGGSSLSIISSTYAKGVKRVQNAIIQGITEVINLFLVNRGCTSYLNNFVLKMKAPSTQEEKDYRDSLSNKITAISNMQSLFADIDTKSRKLKILKSLVGSLDQGDEILQAIQAEIDLQEDLEAKAKAEEEARAAAEAEAAAAGEVDDLDLGGDEENTTEGDEDFDLGSMESVPMESFKPNPGADLLNEDFEDLLKESDDLPSPEELDKEVDFTENN